MMAGQAGNPLSLTKKWSPGLASKCVRRALEAFLLRLLRLAPPVDFRLLFFAFAKADSVAAFSVAVSPSADGAEFSALVSPAAGASVASFISVSAPSSVGFESSFG